MTCFRGQCQLHWVHWGSCSRNGFMLQYLTGVAPEGKQNYKIIYESWCCRKNRTCGWPRCFKIRQVLPVASSWMFMPLQNSSGQVQSQQQTGPVNPDRVCGFLVPFRPSLSEGWWLISKAEYSWETWQWGEWDLLLVYSLIEESVGSELEWEICLLVGGNLLK